MILEIKVAINSIVSNVSFGLLPEPPVPMPHAMEVMPSSSTLSTASVVTTLKPLSKLF